MDRTVYPKRTPSHTLETQSRGILLKSLPPRWLCREVLERDYGIDFYLEMVGDRGLLTGHLAAVQLKGSDRIRWRGKTRRDFADWFYLSGISTKTIYYWMALQLPVFLFVAELSTSKVFFAPVKRQVRARYARFLAGRTFGFRVFRMADLANAFGQNYLSQEYYRERGHESFMGRVRDLVAHRDVYQGLLGSVSRVEDSDVVKPLPWMIASSLAQTCVTILEHVAGRAEKLRVEQRLAALPRIDVLRATAPSGSVFKETLRILYPAFAQCLQLVRDHIVRSECSYWERNDPSLHALCAHLPTQPWP